MDMSFGSNGLAGQDIGPFFSTAWNLLVQPDGNVVTTGDAFNDTSLGDFALIRYLQAARAKNQVRENN